MRIALLGYGRMGKAIEEIAIERGHEIVIRKDVDPIDLDLSIADAAIDFSHPSAAFNNIKDCIDSKVAVVSGTTGWLDRFDEIKSYCEEQGGAFIYASNFSIGVNLFFNLNAHLAKMMEQIKGYDVGMEEIHHVHKLDAPSGTAISLANDILENSEKKQWNIETADSDDLFIKVKREGEVPGTHSVSYTSAIDAIEIKHTAFNRTGFALGRICCWVNGWNTTVSSTRLMNSGRK